MQELESYAGSLKVIASQPNNYTKNNTFHNSLNMARQKMAHLLVF